MAKLSPAVIATAGVANFGFAAIVGGYISDSTWVHIGNWAHDFTTGAPMAGLFAVGASFVALHGINKQVRETRKANALSEQAVRNTELAHQETAKKNREDQWWDTLKWTYTEAKESELSKSTFRTVAAAKILDSLNQGRENLTVQQQRAVDSILDMFGESKEPEVQEAVAPIYRSVGRKAPNELRKEVYDTIRNAFPAVTLEPEALAKGSVLKTYLSDAMIKAPNGKSVILEVIGGTFRSRELGQLVDYVKQDPERRAIIVTDRLSPSMLKMLEAGSSGIFWLDWSNPGTRTQLVHLLSSLLSV